MPAILKKRPPAAQATVDYPRQNEKITSAQYTVRVSAPADALGAEVAVDQGDWKACRQAAGHWWYDWSGYGNGEHEVVARIKTADGKKALSEPKEFFVRLDVPGTRRA